MMMATLMSNLRMFNPRLDSVLHRRTCNGVKKKKYIVDVGLWYVEQSIVSTYYYKIQIKCLQLR